MNRFILIALAGIMLCFGCAYYNTFYNAKKAFSEAEKQRKEALEQGGAMTNQIARLYDEAIENSARVLRDYPSSDLIDDALVLIGDAFVAKQEYPKAVRKYEEVLANYPNSKLAPYCSFALGRTLLAANDTVRAEAALQEFVQKYPKSKWTPEGMALLGDIAFGQQRYDVAISRYNDLITEFPKSDRRHNAQYQIAEAYLVMDRHQEALELFERVGKTARQRDLEFQANYMVGECLLQDRQYENALRKFEALMSKSSYIMYRPRIVLAMAACRKALGQIDIAFEHYKNLTTRYASDREYDQEVARAYYEMGLISEQQGDLVEAETLYGDAKRRSPQSFLISRLATDRADDIHQLQKYRENLDKALADLHPAPTDSAEQASDEAPEPDERRIDEVVQARMKLAELYLFRFGLSDSAVVQYRLARQVATSPNMAAKIAYAEAWVLEHIDADTTASKRLYRQILAEYEDTPYTSVVLQALSLPDTTGPSDITLFRRAETLLFNKEMPDSALVYYRRLIDRYPESEYASRALYAIGWIAETHQHDTQAAMNAYLQLSESYPRTDQGRMAKMKIEAVEDLFKPKATETDSTQINQDTPEDSTRSLPVDMTDILEAATLKADSSAVTPQANSIP